MSKDKVSLQQFFLSEKTYRLTLIALALFGIVLRLRHYLANRSLWLDEAMLALNILDRSFVALTQQPMAYEQGAPIGFLFFAKGTTLLLGDSEYAFRFYSFLTGCAALLLMIFFTKRTLNKAGTLLAVALFASGGYLVYYSAETKQYMGDVAATLILLLLFSRQLHHKFSHKEMMLFSVVNVGILWFSHAAVFVVASVGIILVLHYAIQKDKQGFRFAVLNLFLSGSSAILLYWFHLRHLSANVFLNSFWLEAFMPFPPNLRWFQDIWDGLLFDPLGLDVFPWVALALAIVGFVVLWRKSWQFGAAFLLTIFLTLVASGLQKYPVAGRMLMFAVPIFIILFGAGVDGIDALLKRKIFSYGVIILLSAYLLYSPIRASLEIFRHPLYREHIRPTMAYLNDNIKEDDLVYVYYYAKPAFLFYLPKYHLETSQYVLGQNHQDNPDSYLHEIDDLRGQKRVWVLFSHVYETMDLNEMNFILSYLDKVGKKDREYRFPGTSVYLHLYDLR